MRRTVSGELIGRPLLTLAAYVPEGLHRLLTDQDRDFEAPFLIKANGAFL